MINNFEVGNRIKYLRKENNWSQEELAENLSIKRQTVSSWEDGRITFRTDKLIEICNLFQCDMGFVLGEYDCKTRAATDICEHTGLFEQSVNTLIMLSADYFEPENWEETEEKLFANRKYHQKLAAGATGNDIIPPGLNSAELEQYNKHEQNKISKNILKIINLILSNERGIDFLQTLSEYFNLGNYHYATMDTGEHIDGEKIKNVHLLDMAFKVEALRKEFEKGGE